MNAGGEALTIIGECRIVLFPLHKDTIMNLTASDITRFWGKVAKVDGPGCWEWQASCLSSGGYGAFRVAGVTLRAHRVAYFLGKGNLNPELEILHRCNNPKCCNPAHLEQNTHSANMLQAGQAGKLGHWKPNDKKQFSQEILEDILTSRLSARALGRKYRADHKTILRIKRSFTLHGTD